MSMKLLYVLFCVALAGCLSLLHLVLNRWKFEPKGFVLLLGYGLAASLPVSYATMFPGDVGELLYVVVAVGVASPFVIMETVSLVKGRGSPARSLAGALGMAVMMTTPLVGQRFFWIPALMGLAGMGWFLVPHIRHPGLNPMWLESVIREGAQGAPKGCGYTSKPITVPIRNAATFVGGTFGCGVYVRRDRTVIWMRRTLHDRLGRPNLEVLARVVATRIAARGAEKEGKK